MDNFLNKKVIDANQVFDGRFMETKKLYLYHFNGLPSVNYINRIDGEKAFIAFKEKFIDFILNIYTYSWYKHEKKKFQFSKTVLILKNECVIEFDNDYCEILHDDTQPDFVEDVTALLLKFKERQKRQPSEINIIVRDA